jgi:molecular chaperone GrpE
VTKDASKDENGRAGAEDKTRAGEGGKVGGPGGVGEEVDLDSKLLTLTAERDELKDRMLRIAAEFENWKKRARKEQDDAEVKVRESVLKDLLDVMDNLERAVSAYGDGSTVPPGGVDGPAILKGVALVVRQFQSKLDRYGVKAIAATGEPFDPRIHEAISRVERSDVPPGTVAVELQRGYRIGDRLLRPSMVSVATGPAPRPTAEGGNA